MILRTFNLFLIVIMSVINASASTPQQELALLRCEQLANSDVNAVTRGSVHSAADWSKTFSEEELKVIEGLAKLRILTSQRSVLGATALVDRALKHSYAEKYKEILKDLSSRHRDFSTSELDSILKQEIVRLQALAADENSTEAQEGKRRSAERNALDQNKPIDPNILIFSETVNVPELTGRVFGGHSYRSRVMSDGSLFIKNGNWNLLFRPETKQTEYLPHGFFSVPMPDGKSVVFLSEESQTDHKRNLGQPFRSWTIDIYDVGARGLKTPLPLSLSGIFEPEEGEGFRSVDVSPSGRRLALSSSITNRILIVDIATGAVVDEIENEDKDRSSGSFQRVFFIDEQTLIFIDSKNLYRHNLLDKTSKDVALEEQHGVLAAAISPDRKHVIFSLKNFKLSTYATSDLTLVASKNPFRHQVHASHIKSLPDDSGLYTAVTGELTGVNARQAGFFNLDHVEVFDFNGKYNEDGFFAYDIVVGPLNHTVYVFYQIRNQPMKMDIWRVPWK